LDRTIRFHWYVEIQLPAPISSIDPRSDSGINLLVARRMGIPMLTGVDVARSQFVIDGLFGTGLKRSIGHPYLAAISAINAHRAPVLSIDIPSGLDADDGSIHGAAIRADWTATMVAPKRGFSRGKGPEMAGKVRVIDIGVPQQELKSGPGVAGEILAGGSRWVTVGSSHPPVVESEDGEASSGQEIGNHEKRTVVENLLVSP